VIWSDKLFFPRNQSNGEKDWKKIFLSEISSKKIVNKTLQKIFFEKKYSIFLFDLFLKKRVGFDKFDKVGQNRHLGNLDLK